MAAPHVAGTAALVIANGNATTPNEIRAALETTAEDLGTTGWDATYGWGLVDAFAALNWTAVPPVPNNPPVASNQSVITNEDTAVPITLTATDPDGDPLTYSIVTPPANGILTGTAPNVTYTPNPNYNGPDSFTFKANDGKLDSNIATVSITVNPVNDAPVANPQSVETTQDTPVAITLTGSDVDGDILNFAIVANPLNGTFTPDLNFSSNGILTYTPNTSFIGLDSFTFKVNDGLVDSNIATVSITVTKINHPPVANNQSVTTNEDTPVAITLTATDSDGDVLTYSLVTLPASGTLTGTAPALTFIPNPNFNGLDNFTFKANDGKLDSNLATVSITVNPVNDPPVANNQSVTTIQDTPVNITLTASDIDGDPLTYNVLIFPANGTLSGIAPILTYTPNPGYTGSDSFTFKANDGLVDSNIATVSITVNPAVPTGLKVVSVYARDTYPGRKVDIEATIENLGDTKIDALVTVEVLGLTGVTDKTTETFGPGDIITVELNPRIPQGTVPGTYTALVTVSWDGLQDSGSDTFLVKSISSGGSSDD